MYIILLGGSCSFEKGKKSHHLDALSEIDPGWTEMVVFGFDAYDAIFSENNINMLRFKNDKDLYRNFGKGGKNEMAARAVYNHIRSG